MDSVLTNDSNHTKRSLERHSVSVERRSSGRGEGKADLSIDTTPASLIEDPPEEVSKFAKSIKFTEKKSPLKSMARHHEIVVDDSPNPTSTDESQPSSQASNGSELSAMSSLASKFSNLLSIQTGNVSLGSCGPLTPSTVSSQPSPVSVCSPGVPYAASSPFKGPPGTLIPLPKYFQDLSSIRKGSSSSGSSVTGASEGKNQAQYSVKPEEKQQSQVSYGLGSFAPMSPRSGFSSPGETRFCTLPQDKSSIQNQACIVSSKDSGSSVTGASEGKNQAQYSIKSEEKQQSQVSYGLGSFAPMSLRSGFSSPGETRFCTLPQDKSSSNQNQACIVSSKGTTTSQSTHFQAMTPLSHDSSWHDLSAEDETSIPKSQSIWNKEQKVPSLVPMHFERGFETDDAASAHSHNSSRFHFLTPHTYLPSLTESSNSSDAATPSQREFNPRETNESLALELTSPSDFDLKRKKPTSSLKSRVINSVRSPLKSSTSSLQSNLSLSEVKSFLKQSISSDIVLPTSRGMCQPVNIKLNIQTHSFRSNEGSSEVNVSHLPESGEGNGLESTKEGNAIRYDTRSPFTPNRIDDNCKMVASEPFLPTLTAKDFGISSESADEGQIETPALKPFTPSQVILRNDYLDTACANEKSPLSCNKIEFSETTPDFSHLPSTPLLQVLKNNEPTGSPGQLSSQQGTPYSTKPAGTAVLDDARESPSMLSFLQHEQSCLLAAEPTDEMTQNQLQERIKASPRSAKKRTPWNEYKSRTKRLWNNLEEVKERKMLKEKREEMLKNRMKMKEYSKKLPPPKK